MSRSGFVAGCAMMASLFTFPAIADPSLEPLVRISDESPFGPIGSCGNFPGIGNGIVYIDSEVEPWIEANPADPANIVAVWQQDRWSDGGSRGTVAGVSKDGGNTWVIVPVPGVTDCSDGPWERASDPWVSFSPDGTLHQMTLAFQADPPPDRTGGFGPNAMVVSRSKDGGMTWDDPITLITDDDPRVLNDKNSLTADPTDFNYVYAVWDRLQVTAGDAIDPENIRPGRGPAYGVRFGLGFKGPIYFARTTDGGDSWEPARLIYDPGANNQTIANQIVVLPDGTVVDLFTEILNNKNNDQNGRGFNFNLSLLRSEDKGETWSPPGRPIRAARIFSNGTITPDNLLPVRDASILFDAAVDPDIGVLYTVWQDTRFDGYEAIAFSSSIDGGLTWSAPIKVNQTPALPNPLRSQAFIPSVAVTGEGVIAVTYYDFRNDGDTGELADYFVVTCDTKASDCTNPLSWASEARLTETSFDYLQAPFARGLFLGDYEGLSADSFDHLAGFARPDESDPASVFFRRITQ